MLKNKKGFTIIELMIVIMILMILAALIIPLFMVTTNSEKSKQTSVEIINQDEEVKVDIKKTSPIANKETKVDIKKMSPVVDKNSSKGESNKL